MSNTLHKIYLVLTGLVMTAFCVTLVSCNEFGGYSSKPLFNGEITSVYVEVFDNSTFDRGVEYELTDALAKQIEAKTPYKIVSSRGRADTLISGYIGTVDKAVLTAERETGRSLEKELVLNAVVNWKDLRSGELLIDNQQVSAAASYSEWQMQGSEYGSALAANKLAKRIVELMEDPW